MSDGRGGFDPSRLSSQRPGSIVQQVLSDDIAEKAHGFTEIRVIGVGGAGGNTVNRLVEGGVSGIDFISVNSDLQALDNNRARRKISIGHRLTRGLGTGGDTRLGRQAAELGREDLADAVRGADMVFITAGLGGGTGGGAAPYIASLAQEAKSLTVGVVTRPFRFEGRRRQQIADEGLAELADNVDSLLVVSNERLLEQAGSNVNIVDAFRAADDILHEGITGIANLITTPGLINLDFADVTAIMRRSGRALMGMGSGSGANRALDAADTAMSSPLLEGSINGATGALLNITGGPDMTLLEIQQLAERVSGAVAADANVILGAHCHPRLGDEIRLTVIATGFTS